MAKTEPEPELIGIADAAVKLSKHPTTIRRWITDGLLEARRMPKGGVMIPVEALEALLRGTRLEQERTNGKP